MGRFVAASIGAIYVGEGQLGMFLKLWITSKLRFVLVGYVRVRVYGTDSFGTKTAARSSVLDFGGVLPVTPRADGR